MQALARGRGRVGLIILPFYPPEVEKHFGVFLRLPLCHQDTLKGKRWILQQKIINTKQRRAKLSSHLVTVRASRFGKNEQQMWNNGRACEEGRAYSQKPGPWGEGGSIRRDRTGTRPSCCLAPPPHSLLLYYIRPITHARRSAKRFSPCSNVAVRPGSAS